MLRGAAATVGKADPTRRRLMKRLRQKQPRLKLDPEAYKALRNQVLERDGWRCQNCGSSKDLNVHLVKARSKFGHDESRNLINVFGLSRDNQLRLPRPRISLETEL